MIFGKCGISWYIFFVRQYFSWFVSSAKDAFVESRHCHPAKFKVVVIPDFESEFVSGLGKELRVFLSNKP